MWRTSLRSVREWAFPRQRASADLGDEGLDRQNAASAARVAGLVLSLGVALGFGSQELPGALAVLGVFCAALLSERMLPARWAHAVGPAEAVAVALAACWPLTSGMPVFIYLLIPPAAAGLRFGLPWAAVSSISQMVGLVIGNLLLLSVPTGTLAVWVATSFVLGVIGGLSGGALSATMSRTYAAAAHEERRRLSCEIHDGIASDLALLGYRVDLLLLDETRPIARGEVEALGADIRRILQEARWSINDLRGGRLPEVGLGSALADHVRRAASACGMTAHLNLIEGSRWLPTAVQFELLRIAQEAVTNTRKHSRARNLWVDLDTSSGGVLLRISDDGTYSDGREQGDSTGGYGMAIMKERAQSIGADFSHHPRAGGGTVVEARMVAVMRAPGAPRVNRPRTPDDHGNERATRGREVPR